MLAAQELYGREYVFHKVKQTWYKKEKQSSNYAVVNCCEVFDMDSCTFVPCKDVHRIIDVLSLNELNEYLKGTKS